MKNEMRKWINIVESVANDTINEMASEEADGILVEIHEGISHYKVDYSVGDGNHIQTKYEDKDVYFLTPNLEKNTNAQGVGWRVDQLPNLKGLDKWCDPTIMTEITAEIDYNYSVQGREAHIIHGYIKSRDGVKAKRHMGYLKFWDNVFEVVVSYPEHLYDQVVKVLNKANIAVDGF